MKININLAVISLLVGLDAHAFNSSELFNLDNFGFESKVIYGNDDRQDFYEVNDPMLRMLADSTAALFQNSKIVTSADSTVPASIRTTQYGTSMGLCKTEAFYDQPTGAFCSGSLVGPDLIMTAGHCIKNQLSCNNTSFVFNFTVKNPQDFPNRADVSDIYKCKEIVTTFVANQGADYALVRLDRPVANRSPLKINRMNDIRPGVALTVIGHPSGLPTKVSGGAAVRALQKGYFQTNLDTYGGNSGSAVFNSSSGLVEGILVRGENDFVNNNRCRASYRCADDGCRGEDVTNINELANLIPEF